MSTMKGTVLIVDDIKVVLDNAKALLESRNFNVLVASSGAEGLGILERNQILVVVSDQRMDPMSGTEFLKRVRQKYPLIATILLSAYTDMEPTIEAINEADVTYFVKKENMDNELEKAVQKGMTWHQERLIKEKAQKMTKEGPTVLTNYQVMSVGIVSAEDKQTLLIGGVSAFQMNARQIDPEELNAQFYERFKNLHVLFIDVDQVGWEKVPPRPPSVPKGINGKDYPYLIAICSDSKRWIPHLREKGFYDCLDQNFVKDANKLSRYLMRLPSVGEEDFRKVAA